VSEASSAAGAVRCKIKISTFKAYKNCKCGNHLRNN